MASERRVEGSAQARLRAGILVEGRFQRAAEIALHPFLDRFADRGFLYLGYDLKVFYAYSLTAGLLSLCVYLYAVTLLNDTPAERCNIGLAEGTANLAGQTNAGGRSVVSVQELPEGQ